MIKDWIPGIWNFLDSTTGTYLVMLTGFALGALQLYRQGKQARPHEAMQANSAMLGEQVNEDAKTIEQYRRERLQAAASSKVQASMPDVLLDLVSASFRPAYERYKQELGSPKSKEEVADKWFYQASHELAMVIFGRPLGGFYILPNDSTKSWAFVRDSGPDDSNDKWRDNEWLRKRFKPPRGKKPPFLGVASHWHKDPEKWEWIKWRVWHCVVGPDKVFFQDFDGGRLIGPLKASMKEDHAQVFVVLDKNHSWHSVFLKIAIDCRDPETYRDPDT